MNHPLKYRSFFSAALRIFLIVACAPAHAQNTRPEVTFYADKSVNLSLTLMFDLENKGRLCGPPAKTVILKQPSEGIDPWTFFHEGSFSIDIDGKNQIAYGSYYFTKANSNGDDWIITMFKRAGAGEKAFGSFNPDGNLFCQEGKEHARLIGRCALMKVTTPEGEKSTAQVARFINPDTPWSVALGARVFQAKEDGTLIQKGWVGWRKITTPEGKRLVILMTKSLDKSAKWAGRYGGVLYIDGIAQANEASSLSRKKTTKKFDDGSTYDGEMIGNKRDGRGTYASADGNTYVGEWKDDLADGQGVFSGPDGEKYSGGWKGGFYEGSGAYTSAKGDTYVGNFKAGKKNGRGKMTWAGGDSYSGEWKDGRFEGQGTYVWVNGNKYVGNWQSGKRFNGAKYDKAGRKIAVYAEGVETLIGEWQDGQKDGQGTYLWASGDVYVGECKTGVIAGNGTKTWKNGDTYSGEWENDKCNGRGTKKWANGDVYAGGWKDDEYDGQGTYTWANGGIYTGDWRNGKRDGQGTRTWPDGSQYSGEWKVDKNEGQGKYRWANGNTFAGEFRDGKMYAGEICDKSGKVIARYKNGTKE